jgi:ribonuclease D
MMYQKEISSEEVAELELIQFEGPISVVDSRERFDDVIGTISGYRMLGFDTETRPSFRKGRVYPTALIQIASSSHVWLFRVNRLGYPQALIDLLSSGSIIKVGSGLNDDLRRMRCDIRFEPAGFLDLQHYVEAFSIGEKGLRKLAAIVLNRRISKSQQVSNWDADILTEQQLRYAATDAWVCLEIYSALRNSSRHAD